MTANVSNSIWILFKREFHSFFATPVAYVFITIFTVVSSEEAAEAAEAEE